MILKEMCSKCNKVYIVVLQLSTTGFSGHDPLLLITKKFINPFFSNSYKKIQELDSPIETKRIFKKGTFYFTERMNLYLSLSFSYAASPSLQQSFLCMWQTKFLNLLQTESNLHWLLCLSLLFYFLCLSHLCKYLQDHHLKGFGLLLQDVTVLDEIIRVVDVFCPEWPQMLETNLQPWL